MKSLLAMSKAAIGLAVCAACTLSSVQANVTLTPTSALKAQGITSRHFNMVSISPNNRYVCGYTREMKRVSGHPAASSTIYIMPVAPNGALGKARVYPLNDISRIEQACFTPDSSAVVFTTKAGATFMRLDISSGAITTIMEHTKASPALDAIPR